MLECELLHILDGWYWPLAIQLPDMRVYAKMMNQWIQLIQPAPKSSTGSSQESSKSSDQPQLPSSIASKPQLCHGRSVYMEDTMIRKSSALSGYFSSNPMTLHEIPWSWFCELQRKAELIHGYPSDAPVEYCSFSHVISDLAWSDPPGVFLGARQTSLVMAERVG